MSPQLADLQKQSGDDEAAELAVSEGLSIFEALDTRAGPNDGRRCNIANGQMVLADIFARTGRTAEARELFRSSGQTFKELPYSTVR